TARSISSASRTPTGRTSTPNDGAAAWIPANWPIPVAMAGSRRTATRFSSGAISLSSSSNFALRPYSYEMKPVALPPGCARLSTKPAPTGALTFPNPIRAEGLGVLPSRNCRARGGQDNIRCEREQFRRVPATAVGIDRAPTVVDPHVTTGGPAQLLQPLRQRGDAGRSIVVVGGEVHQYAHAPPPPRLVPG